MTPGQKAMDIAIAYEATQTSGQQYQARCPVHDDNHASLCIGVGEDGRVLVHCQAGCKVEDVLAAKNLTLADLFAEPRRKRENNGWGPWCQERWGNFDKAYNYYDENGKFIKQVVRTDKKQFPQRQPKQGGGWTYKTKDLPKLLYRLPQLLKADISTPVFLVEGEKDVETLEAWGFLATCNEGGAGKFYKEHAARLKGRQIIALPDNDESGRQHIKQAYRLLRGIAANVAVLELPDLRPKGDVSDWKADGGTKEQFLELLASIGDDLPDWLEVGQESEPPAAGEPAIDQKQLAIYREAVRRIEAGEAAANVCKVTLEALKQIEAENSKPEPPPTFRDLENRYPSLRRPVIDGLLREGETMNIIAPPKFGKSWLVTDLGLTVVGGGHWLGKFWTSQGNVLIIDNELHGETSVNRIPKVAEAKGLDLDDWKDGLYVENLRGQLRDIDSLGKYFGQFKPGDFKIVIIDAFYRALPPGTDENDNGAIAAVYNTIDNYAASMACAFVLIHHTSKGNQAGKSVTDVGSGAGSQSRATDCHLVMRQHEEKDVVVLDGAVRSWAPIEPICLRWNFPSWTIADGLDPHQLRQPAGRKAGATSKNSSGEKKSTFEKKCELAVEKFKECGPLTQTKLKQKISASSDKAREVIEVLLEEGRIEPCETPTGDGYRLRNQSEEVSADAA